MEKKKSLAKPKKHSEVAQIGRFGLVGILNTIVDFGVYNLLLILFASLAPVVASVISGTAAMINSFIFNRSFTFKAKKLSPVKTILFFVVTLIGLYIIRPIVVWFFTGVWLWPAEFAHHITSWLHLSFSQDFITHNAALVAAIAVVLVYNYLAYKYLIFNEKSTK